MRSWQGCRIGVSPAFTLPALLFRRSRPEHGAQRGHRRRHMKEDDRRTQTAPRPTADLGQPVWVSSGLLVPQDVLTNCFHTGSYRLISFWWGVAQLPLILLHMYTFTSSYLKKIFLKVQFKWKQSNNCKADLITSKGQGTWMTITDNSKCTHRLILLTSKEATI